MPGVEVVIFHQPPRREDPPLVALLAEARGRLLEHQSRLFRDAGAASVHVVPGREEAPPGATATGSFGRRVAELVDELALDRLIVLGSGAVPLLSAADARALVGAASAQDRQALTNNRYSSDICAVSHAAALRDLPPLPSDNALPRWLEELRGFAVRDLPGRDRLALDLDTPLDLALLMLAPRPPAAVVASVATAGIAVPRREELRALARDPRAELLVLGRSGSRTLRWLERHVRCRVRFLSEERGLRASTLLAIGGRARDSHERPPRSAVGRLLEARGGPGALPAIVAELGDGAIVDSRVLVADRAGRDEAAWPSAADRFASDLLRADEVADPWLRDLTAAAAGSEAPILLGSHTLIGPGIPLVLGARG